MSNALVRMRRDHTKLAELWMFEIGETKEALDRAIKRIEKDIEIELRCPACSGTGRYEEGPVEEHDDCGVCNGSGRRG